MMAKKGHASQCKKRRFVSHGGDVWGFSRKHNIPVKRLLDFSAPINYLGASPKAIEAIKKFAELVKFYPDPNPVELRRELAEYVGKVSPDNIIIGNGSTELIYMVPEVFSPNFKAIIPVPSFTEYEKATLRAHGEPIFVKLPEDFSLNLESIKKVVTSDTRIVFVCNPHSPSGTLYDKQTILELADFCHKNNIVVCIDENYIEFAESGENCTVASYVKKYDNLFVIRSLTKFYAMPGLRFGYAIADQDFICALQDVRQPWSINSLAVFAARAALKDTEFIEKTRSSIAREKAQLARMIKEISVLQVFPSETNFLLVKILYKKTTSTALRESMAKEGILIRDCSTFVGLDDSYFRVTVRSSEENLKLVKALKEALK
jgi:threonine-phosphate decarboxylase